MRFLVLLVLAGCFDYDALRECNGATAWLCDDLERGTYADAWSPHNNGLPTGVVDTVHAHNSKYALHVSGTPAASGDEWVAQYKSVPQTANVSEFVRTYLYVPALPAQTTALYTTVEEPSPYDGERILLGTDGTITLHGSLGGGDVVTTAAIPLSRWTCVEWEVDEANAGAMNLWFDDNLVASWTGKTMPVNKLAFINLGAVFQGTLPATPTQFDIWYDDIILDGARITCRQ